MNKAVLFCPARLRGQFVCVLLSHPEILGCESLNSRFPVSDPDRVDILIYISYFIIYSPLIPHRVAVLHSNPPDLSGFACNS